jgi:hypothetical protein
MQASLTAMGLTDLGSFSNGGGHGSSVDSTGRAVLCAAADDDGVVSRGR